MSCCALNTLTRRVTQAVRRLVLPLLLLGLLVSCENSAERLTLNFIDVGQGDAVLIRSPSGQNVLYDGGRPDEEVLEYLQSVGVTKLELVIASHADADHIGGLEAVVRFYRPRFFMDNGLPHDTQTYRGLLEAVQDADAQVIPATARRIGLGDASLQVVPPPDDPSLDSNDHSVGIVVSYGKFQAALTGDAEKSEFDWWLENVPELLEPVAVYKAAHHGSPNGDSAESIETFRPKTVVISVGRDNAYGHPSAEALALYKGVGAEVYRTDQSGTIGVSAAQSGSYQVSVSPTATNTEPERTDTASSPASDDTDRDCSDFETQAEAQAFFKAAGPGDPNRLDGNGDGVVCTSLP